MARVSRLGWHIRAPQYGILDGKRGKFDAACRELRHGGTPRSDPRCGGGDPAPRVEAFALAKPRDRRGPDRDE